MWLVLMLILFAAYLIFFGIIAQDLGNRLTIFLIIFIIIFIYFICLASV